MKRTILCSVSVIALGGLAGFAASPASAAEAAAAATASPTVAELVVTAQRRSQNIETVPVAVTALSAQTRALVGISTIQDITDYTPGLSYSSIDDRPYIRGVGRNTDNLSTASAVATYYNGVYYGANAAIILQKDDLFISSIEVDRGPQNTLHGSNSDGGTILYTSQRPTSTYYAEARGLIGNYSSYMGEAVVSGPLSDHVRIRLGGMYTDDDSGFFHNLDGPPQGGNLALGSSGKAHYLEAQIAADYGHLDLWAMVSSGEFNANYYDQQTVGNIPSSLFLNGQFEPSGFYGLCGIPGFAATANGAGCAGGPAVVSVTTLPVTANIFPGNNPGNVNPRDFIAGFTSTSKQTGNLAIATNVTYHFPSADLTWIGGFQTFNYILNFNANGNGLTTESGVTSYQLAGAAPAVAGACEFVFAASNPGGCLQPLTINPNPSSTFFQEKDQFFSNEIDLISHSSSPLQYIFGAYQYFEHYSQPVNAGVEPNQPQMSHPMYVNGVTGTCPVATDIFCPAPALASAAFSTSDTVLSYNDFAVFGDLSYKFNEHLKVNGAVRYTYDHKAGYQLWRFVEFDGAIPGFPDSTGFGANTPAIDLTSLAVAQGSFPGTGPATFDAANGNWYRNLAATWQAVTGEADIDWTPNPDTLIYFRYARGYKSGGYSTYTIGAFPETQPEYLDSYEVGGKWTPGSFTLNAAGFYYNYQNDQVPLTVQTNGILVPVLYNLPSVHTYGIEFEGVWRPMENLSFSLNYAHLHATIANDGGCLENTNDPLALLPGSNTAGCVQNGGPGIVLQHINGQFLPEAPKNKVSFNALYTLKFEPGDLTLSGSVIWKDVTYDDVFNRWYSKQPSYTLVNLRATWRDSKDRYNVILFCDNVFNITGYDSAAGLLLSAPGPSQDIVSGYGLTAPRTYGVELEVRFR
ncbi:MAG TPA: TonB-dependent receptor [Caulobacteraceae bacterium]|nr:TonB-dependent receptor [Caulobacteraceae bacterium]